MGSWRYRKWAGAAAVFTGLMGVAVATVVVEGSQLVNSPMATAGTTRATPWVPRPNFLPAPVPKPRTSIGGQVANQAQEKAKAAAWIGKASPPFSAMSEGMTALGNALGGTDVAAVRKACSQLSSAGDKFEATLPAPTDELDDESEAAVEELDAMHTACKADPIDIAGVQQHATEANSHLSNIAKLASG